MPIKVPKGLPAVIALQKEGIKVVEHEAMYRPIERPLHMGLLNLMPNKIETEIQIARLLGATSILVDLTLVKIASHLPKNTPASHLASFYQDWEGIKERIFDGFIITGAPVELIPFEEVGYWNELIQIFNWTQTNTLSCFNICWAAQAALYHFHGLPKYTLNEKAFGVFRHQGVESTSPYLRGLSDDLFVPVSRWTEMRRADIPSGSGICVLIESPETGLCLLDDPNHHSLHIFNHIEYDSQTLADEYFRDRSLGRRVNIPANYFPEDCEDLRPRNCWRSHAHIIFGNWIKQIGMINPHKY
ncbi:homoserine O-succinyltransferase [Paraburkholderia youngii]|uniref:homoserine O-succinyltransferase n=1 Tax=Paraburkholderia youngii TaxID=2782701 RepID=UPI003D20A861